MRNQAFDTSCIIRADDHSVEEDMDVLILQSGLSKSQAQREHFEDRWISMLQTLQKTGINLDCHQYAKDMYASYGRTKN